jgi:hypothetical protein
MAQGVPVQIDLLELGSVHTRTGLRALGIVTVGDEQ